MTMPRAIGFPAINASRTAVPPNTKASGCPMNSPATRRPAMMSAIISPDIRGLLAQNELQEVGDSLQEQQGRSDCQRDLDGIDRQLHRAVGHLPLIPRS